MRRERDITSVSSSYTVSSSSPVSGGATLSPCVSGGRPVFGRPRYITLPIISVLSVIGYVYYVTIFGVVEDWLGLKTATGLWNAGAFSALALMCLATYAIAVVRDPGQVPSSYMPDVEDPQVAVQEIKRKGGDLRYCQKCSQYKPPRAHHCRVCKKCILRMMLAGSSLCLDKQLCWPCKLQGSSSWLCL